MSTLGASVASLLLLAGAGALPVVALVGCRWVAIPMAPLAGAVLAGVAGGCCLVVAGTPLPWFLALSTAAALVSLYAMVAQGQHSRSPRRRPPDAPRRPRADRVAGAAGFGAVVIAAAWGLRLLRVPSTGWDARDIWMMRASWFADGHRTVLAAFRNRELIVAHASYPPLVSATVATAWQLTGLHTDRLGVVLVSALTACAIATPALAIIDAGRAAGGAGGAGKWLPLAVGVLAAGLFVLTVYGVFGQFTANGYADPLWSAAAVGALGFGLLLPRERSNIAAAAILLAVAGLTKVEGTATAMAVVGLLAARAAAGNYRRASPTTVSARLRTVARPLLAGLAGAAALSVWAVVTRLEDTAPDVSTFGPRQGTIASRAHLTLDWMVPHLHVLLLAVPLAVVAGLFLATARQRVGLGNDAWLWLGLGAGLAAVALAYVTGRWDTQAWLLTSVHRTTMFPVVAAWLVVAGWVVVAAAGPVTRHPAPVPEHAPRRAGIVCT